MVFAIVWQFLSSNIQKGYMIPDMGGRLRVFHHWSYHYDGVVDNFALASVSGDCLISDRRNRLLYLGSDGKVAWRHTTDFTPLKSKLTESGDHAFVLTVDGHLINIARNAQIEWDYWTDNKPVALAIKPDGEAALVGSLRACFHVINSHGKRIKLVHTEKPVIYANFSSESGDLFVASAHGWVGIYSRYYKPERQYDLGYPVAQIEVSEYGRKLFIPAMDNGLQKIEIENSELVTYDPQFSVNNVSIDQKGDRILAVSLDGQAALMDGDGARLWHTKTEHSWVHCEMARAGDRFVLVSDEGNVICYKIGLYDETMTDHSHYDYLEI